MAPAVCHLKTLEQFGLIDDSFKLLGFRAKNSTPEENEVVLSIDELSIKPEIKFDTTNKCLSGFINIPRSKDDQPKGIFVFLFQ